MDLEDLTRDELVALLLWLADGRLAVNRRNVDYWRRYKRAAT